MSTRAVLAEQSPASTANTVVRRIRAGAVALIMAGVLYLPVPFLLAGVPPAPAQNTAFALGADTVAWRAGMALSALALTLFMLGSFALYGFLSRTRVERWAFAGLVVTAGLVPLFLVGMGLAMYVAPAVGSLIRAGDANAVVLMDQIFKEPFLIVVFLTGILYNVGYICTGFAIWRSGVLFKWGGLAFILMGLLGIPGFLDVALAGQIATLAGGAAGIASGISLWRESETMAGYSRD